MLQTFNDNICFYDIQNCEKNCFLQYALNGISEAPRLKICPEKETDLIVLKIGYIILYAMIDVKMIVI